MHLWIRDSVRSLWQSRHFTEAVRAAAVKLNAETQNKLLRRDISETDLFRQRSQPSLQPERSRGCGSMGTTEARLR
jgi:hypothetical protein